MKRHFRKPKPVKSTPPTARTEPPRLPLLPGPWHRLVVKEETELLGILSQGTIDKLLAHGRLGAWHVAPVPFWPQHALVQVEVRTEAEVGAADLLVGDSSVTLLEGDSRPIHDLNRQLDEDGSLVLRITDDADLVAHYLRFFNQAMRAESGSFRIVERAEHLLALGAEQVPPELAAALRPVEVSLVPVERRRRARDVVAKVSASVCHARGLFHAEYLVRVTGDIDMIDDDHVAADIVPEERWQGPVRNLVSVPRVSHGR
jgi:hypothetical protein